MDEMVLRAQRFINSVYGSVPGINKVAEDGITGWSTMYALTRCLQHQLGITTLSDNFGPTTMATLTAQWPSINRGTGAPANLVRIIQSGLYCKGYDGGEIDGIYNDRVSAGVSKLKADAGVGGLFAGDAMVPKLFKALLTMDAYVPVSGGAGDVRGVQQWLNGRYAHRPNFFIIPCDGHFSRDVQKALLKALQYEFGTPEAQVDGVFGPMTQAGLRANEVAVGSAGVFVQLFTGAMIFNRRNGVAFSSSFGSELQTQVRDFQSFVKLATTGRGDYQTWASLVVSHGDTTRRGTACDCVTEITTARAQALKAAGYAIVGRYLTNVPNTSLNKKIQPGELAVISGGGLRVFPIYQTYGGSVTYFNPAQGAADALAALDAARGYGFKRGTRIYFAVDFDALDSDVTSNIIPHFRAIKTRFGQYASEYQIGIYGPRNVCSRVAREGLTTASFVSDMSSGFSGNLGFPMPEDWAFDQISTITVGSGDGRIEIDNNIASGRDSGQNTFDAVSGGPKLDVAFDAANRGALIADLAAYLEGIGYPERPWQLSNADTVDRLLNHDGLFTGLARAFRIRKALLQAPAFFETRMSGPDDALAEAAVTNWYTYKIAYEAWEEAGKVGPEPTVPIPVQEDSSTGIGQIRAGSAISARNYCARQGITEEAVLDDSDWHVMWDVWKKLKNDNEYNISTIPLLHFWGAADIGVARPGLADSDDLTRRVIARYNGTGTEADQYGVEVLGIYRVFEKYNAPARNLS
ncbi:glycoside hydrolase domain-containing protein [Nonomuraea rubra]|uniref:Peptidoglycan hydrolase-like protein with peptidoglycan-binding domain n=1 Tax=Nonomuraea rubra TaxID=46180 RepID=A0A7X0TW81_9ACTN|nr:glycoside hydrolase domain-containing protein [Nonomuraea rubra]MBB6546136.1 peptidoglycan hydrolase-like protein with peptidoglycan-binding domain [Nonomuraea rubra]